MKIVFIEPKGSTANIYSKIKMPLLGPSYLGAILKQRGHEVEIYNEDIGVPDYSRLKADVIGISILTPTARRGYEIAKKFPKEKVIMGGVHASLVPEEALSFARQVVKGEAEAVIADVVEARRLEPIVEGVRIEDLDSLPFPDFSLIKGYHPRSALILPVSTSRGCPFGCSFCSVTKVFGRKYRFRSPENIIAEVNRLKAKSIFFCDDNFTANKQRTDRLLDLLIKEKSPKWACQLRAETAKDDTLVNKMRRSGCRLVCVGFESVNPDTLKAYQKNQTIEEMVYAIHKFHKKRIKVHGMFVLGGEDDSKKTVWQTLRFALKERLDTIQMTILTPFPGTKVYDDLTSQRRIFTKDWNLYDGQHIVFKPRLLSARQLQANVVLAHKRFYSITRTVRLLFKFHLRNALFRLMGWSIVKEWLRHNEKMKWLDNAF